MARLKARESPPYSSWQRASKSLIWSWVSVGGHVLHAAGLPGCPSLDLCLPKPRFLSGMPCMCSLYPRCMHFKIIPKQCPHTMAVLCPALYQSTWLYCLLFCRTLPCTVALILLNLNASYFHVALTVTYHTGMKSTSQTKCSFPITELPTPAINLNLTTTITLAKDLDSPCSGQGYSVWQWSFIPPLGHSNFNSCFMDPLTEKK